MCVKLAVAAAFALAIFFATQALTNDANTGFSFPAAAIPETTIWAMLLGGFVMLGGVMRMRRHRLAFA